MGRNATRPPPPKKAPLWATAVLFAASFGGGLGAAALVRQSQGGASQAAGPQASALPKPPSPEIAAQAEAQFQQGVELLREERSAEALEAFQKASSLDPTDPRPFHGMGKVYQQLFLHDKAEECYRSAVACDPRYRPSREKLAMLCYEKGKHAEAVAILKALEKETPNEPFVWGELAINAIALGHALEAVALLEKYRAARPQDAWGRAHLGKAYAEAGRTKEAEAEYRAAIALDKHMAIPYWWLAQLLVSTQREGEAKQHTERYQRLRQLSTDEHQLQMALLKDPQSLNGLVGLSRVQLLQGKVAPSRAALERAKTIAPEDPRVKELEGIHARIGQGAPEAK